ncbi:hypothetical protein [Streptomyces lavendulae]
MSEADLAVDSGQSLLDLGDSRRAHQFITEGQALLPDSRAKTRGVFLAYEAASYLQLKEPERAAHAAEEALALSRRIGAPRCERLLQGLVPDFQPYRAADGVPAFLALTAA